MSKELRDYYTSNPLMVSSPFGGVDGINRDLLIRVLAKLGISLRRRSVLDIGCGRGFTGEVVKSCGGQYTGMDFVLSGSGFPLIQGDAQALPFPDAAFDAVFCIDAFEHFPEMTRAASEFRRVLRPDGFVFLSAPNYSNVAGLVKSVYERLGWYARDSWAPFRNWQAQELEQPLTGGMIRRTYRQAGFRRFRRIGHPAEVGLGLFPWVEHAKMPERIKFRLQRLFAAAGPMITPLWPGASLHGFWKIEV